MYKNKINMKVIKNLSHVYCKYRMGTKFGGCKISCFCEKLLIFLILRGLNCMVSHIHMH